MKLPVPVITGPRIRLPGRICHMWPTQYGYLTLRGMALITGIPFQTIRARMFTYFSERDPRVFEPDVIPEVVPPKRQKPREKPRKKPESIRVGSLEEKYLSRG